MSKHTPGPWEYFPATNYEGFAIAPRLTLPTLAAVRVTGPGMIDITAFNFPGDTEANAKLIASAPELLDALKRMYLASTNFSCMPSDDDIEVARSAIAKATGET